MGDSYVPAERLSWATLLGRPPRPIRVMHVVDALLLAGMEYGVIKIANGLPEEIEPSICCLRFQADVTKAVLDPRVRVIPLERPTRHNYGLALWQMETICDMGFFLEAAVRANPLLGPDGLRAGFELLGAGVPSALTFATLLSPSRHASANAVRDVAFVCTTANCSDGHFAYTSKTSYER